MLDCVSQPRRVSLEVEGEEHPAVALELTGQRAALRSSHSAVRLSADDDVCVQLDWGDGATTSLPGVVRAVAPAGPMGAENLVHVELTRVEGDWDRFLAYVGPTMIAG